MGCGQCPPTSESWILQRQEGNKWSPIMNMKAEVLDCSPGRKEAWGEGCDTTRQLRASQYVMIRQFPVGDTVKVFWKWYLRWFWLEGRQFRERAWEPLGDCEIWSRCCTVSFCKSYNERKDVNVKPFRLILPSCTIPSFNMGHFLSVLWKCWRKSLSTAAVLPVFQQATEPTRAQIRNWRAQSL